jgi:hypothetical protein
MGTDLVATKNGVEVHLGRKHNYINEQSDDEANLSEHKQSLVALVAYSPKDEQDLREVLNEFEWRLHEIYEIVNRQAYGRFLKLLKESEFEIEECY